MNYETLIGRAQPTINVEDAVVSIRIRGQEKCGVCDLIGSAYPPEWDLAAEPAFIEVWKMV